MAFPRASTSSYQSKDSTAIDPESAFSSPNLAQKNIGQRPSTEHGNCESRDPPVSSGSSVSSKRDEYRERYGWPRLAEIMADIPEFAAFPRYRDLNLINLLYYKAQIDNLKMKLLRQEEEQKLNLERFDHIANENNPTEHISVKTYRQMLTDLRVLLSGYSKSTLETSALLIHSQKSQMKRYFSIRMSLHCQAQKRIICGLCENGSQQKSLLPYVVLRVKTRPGTTCLNLQNPSGVELELFSTRSCWQSSPRSQIPISSLPIQRRRLTA